MDILSKRGIITRAALCLAFAIGIGFTQSSQASPAAAPLATYHMDESAWNGTAGGVLDSSGNGNNAQSFNSATTASATPAISTNPGTCSYGVFDNGSTVTNGYVLTPLPNLTTDFTIAAWIRTTNHSPIGQRILIDDQNKTGGYGFSLGDGGGGTLRFYTRSLNQVVLDSTYVIANNTWYFVAAVADITNKTRAIYVFNSAGTLLNSTGAVAFTGTWGTDAGPVSIGGETNASAEAGSHYHFLGNLDEVQIYTTVLNQAALAALATQTHACTAVGGPDHILIQHDGNGLTCTPETLTVVACANAACTAPNYTAGAVTGNITWAGTPGGTIPFSIAANGTGTTTVSLPVSTAQTVTLGSSAVSPAASSTCWNTGNSTASCSLLFANAALLLNTPNLVAGTSQNMTISAVRSSNNGLNCVPAFANVSRTVNLKCAYTNPTSGTLPAQVAGVALNAAHNTAACDATGQSLSLSFSSSGVATSALQYNDVGQMAVNATYTGSVATGDSGLSMTGNGSFIAAPASFAFSGITAAPIKAGNAFNATVTANNSLGSATPNFGKETSPEGVTLTRTKYQPTGAGAVPGIFSGSVGTFNNGAATGTNLNWSEVGTIDLTATLASGSYLGSGLTAAGTTGTTGAVGRFIPDHFNTAVTQGCGIFTYSGQPFTVQVTALNASGVTTLNYDGTLNTSPNFSKAATLSHVEIPSVAASLSTTGTTCASPCIDPNSFSSGVATASPTFAFTTTPTTPTATKLRAIDTDNVSSASPATPVEGAATIRSGRLLLSNFFGIETNSLKIPVKSQYWSGSSWVLNSDDSCTTIPVASVALENYRGASPPWTTTASGPGSLAGGQGAITLAAPGATGSVDVALNLGVTAYDNSCSPIPHTPTGILTASLAYLRGKNGNCTAPADPSATATFGIYSPETKKTMHVRELY